jgi:hypothetical protein
MSQTAVRQDWSLEPPASVRMAWRPLVRSQLASLVKPAMLSEEETQVEWVPELSVGEGYG